MSGRQIRKQVRLDRLSDPDGTVADRLAAAGLLAPPVGAADAPTGAELRALEAEVDAWLDAHPTGLGLSAAVDKDRDGR